MKRRVRCVTRSHALPPCPRPTPVLSDSQAMTTPLPWPTASTFPVSKRRREGGRIRGKSPVSGDSSAGLGPVRRTTHPRSPGPVNSRKLLAINRLANNCSGEKSMHVACYGYRYFDPLTGRWPSKDPIDEAAGPNLYTFLKNNGIVAFDYLGLDLVDDCNKKVTELIDKSPVVEIRRALVAKKCKQPRVKCDCCLGPEGGSYKRDARNDKGETFNLVTICANRWNEASVTEPARLGDISGVLHHEYIHAWQDCSGSPNGYPEDGGEPGSDDRCKRSVCWEIQAYANSTCAGKEGDLKNICIKTGVRFSSKPNCRRAGDPLPGIQSTERIDALLEEKDAGGKLIPTEFFKNCAKDYRAGFPKP